MRRLFAAAAVVAALFAAPPVAMAADESCITDLEGQINEVLMQFGERMPAEVEAEWSRLSMLGMQAYQEGDVDLTCARMADVRDYLASELAGGNLQAEEADCLSPLQEEVNGMFEQVADRMTPDLEAQYQEKAMAAADAAGAGDMALACERAAEMRDFLVHHFGN